jgi:hypothetical protein
LLTEIHLHQQQIKVIQHQQQLQQLLKDQVLLFLLRLLLHLM